MITDPLRSHANRCYAAAVPFAVLGILIAIGVLWYTIPEGGNIGIGLVVIMFFNAPWMLLVADGSNTNRDADEYDRHTRGIDGRYHMDWCEAVSGVVQHFDYIRGTVWEEWEDASGYHTRTVRKLTAAEVRENEILCKSGGYGNIDYRGDQ